MKRKRGNAKGKPKKPSLVGANEAVPKVVGLNDDYSVDDLLCEYDAVESEIPQEEPSMNGHQVALEQVVANAVNSVRNTSLGNLSKFAASRTTNSSRAAGAYAESDSRMETETPRAETNMNGRQTDSEKGGAAVNGMMGLCPNVLRDMIISVISDLSKNGGGIIPNGVANNPISNAPVFHSQGERTNQEVSPSQNPQYKEQEIYASLWVIKRIMKLDAAEPFSVPVDPIALGIPDYFDVIDTPMDFGTICYNLENGLKYMNSEDVYKDVQHIWENCSKYNKPGDKILELMKRVKTNFMKRWTAAGLYTERDQDQASDALGRIPVAINDLGQPIGNEASQLTSFLGVMARDGNLAPLTYPSWSKMPKENKEDMWKKVQSKFDIDPASKNWVLKSLGQKWRNFKANLKLNHYDTHSTDAERLADCDTRVLPDQWSVLVSQWNSEKWQEISAKNKANRANQKFTHATGKKSFARIREEEKAKRPDGKEPTRAELFILTRTRKDGKPVNEATAAVISELRERTAQQPDTIENRDPQADILAEVLGPDKKGNTRLHELRPSPTVRGAQNPSLSDAMRIVSEANSKVDAMNEKMVSMEQMCTQMAAQMATMTSMMTSMQNSQNKHSSIVVANTSYDSEELPQQSVYAPTSCRVVAPRQAKAKLRKRT